MLTSTLPVRLTTYRGQESRGQVRVVAWDRKERMKRAIKVFLICWGLAIVFIPIPPIHWVAVPLFILAGPIMAAHTFGKESEVEGGEGTCPNCGKPFEVAKRPVNWPLKDLCGECQEAVEIQPLDAAAADTAAPTVSP